MIEALDSSSVCCLLGVTFVTSKTYQPNCVLTGPVSLPFLAAKIALSKAGSCWPLATPGSAPPLLLEAWSTEYFLATDFQDWPDSSAFLACAAFALSLVSTMRRSRRSGEEKRDLFLL